MQPTRKAVGGALVLYLTRGWRLPTLFPSAPCVEDREGVSRAWGPGRRALTTPRLCSLPTPFQPRLAVGEKEEKLFGLLGPPTHPTV